MAPDQRKPAADGAETGEVLVVEPGALTSAAHLLDDLPGPHSPAPTPPSAEAVGHPALAGDIREFHQRYAAVAHALAADNDTTASHLDSSAAAYRRTDADTAARLADLRDGLPAPRPPHTSDPNTSDQNTNDDDQNDDDRATPDLYEI